MDPIDVQVAALAERSVLDPTPLANERADIRGINAHRHAELPSSVRVYLASEPVDLRRGHDGLVAIVRSPWQLNPYDGHLSTTTVAPPPVVPLTTFGTLTGTSLTLGAARDRLQ